MLSVWPVEACSSLVFHGLLLWWLMLMSSWLLLLLLSWCWSGEGGWGVLQSPTSDLYLVGIDTQDVQPLTFSMVVVFKVIIVAVPGDVSWDMQTGAEGQCK